MRRALIGCVIPIFSWVAIGCAAPPTTEERLQETAVITKHGPKVDFGEFETYHLRGVIRTLNDEGELEPLEESVADVLLDATANNLDARGYTSVDSPADAELAVEMLYLDFVTTSVWCYSWWDYYYWGYPGWGYYPYYGTCDGTAWRSGLLVTVIVDLTEARANPGGGGGAGGEGGGGNSSLNNHPGIWFSGVYGVELTSREAVDGINQAFTQSPYVKTSR